jgi:hypothetical protein
MKKNYGGRGGAVGSQRAMCKIVAMFINVILPEWLQMKADVTDCVHIIYPVGLVLRAAGGLACDGVFRLLQVRSWVTEKWREKEDNIYKQLNSCTEYL